MKSLVENGDSGVETRVFGQARFVQACLRIVCTCPIAAGAGYLLSNGYQRDRRTASATGFS
jgi:hypothetical protein